MLNNLFGRRQDEARVREEGRLPPGQALTNRFPVLHYGPVPPFNPATWSKFDTDWEGVALKTLVDGGLIRLKPTARYLMQHCEYGFTVNVPLEVALAPNFLLATHYDGQPLTPDHGYPLRGVIGHIPGTEHKTPYLWKGGKWLRGLEFMAWDRLGFWEQAGYHNEADIWKEERFAYG